MDGDDFLRRMRKGDAGVWDDLMPVLRKLALGACRDLRVFDQLKDDIVQDVAIKVFTNWESFQGQSKLSVWIYSIARNRCLDEMRKTKVRKETTEPPQPKKGKKPLEENDNERSFLESAPDKTISNMEQRLCIQQIISELESHPKARKGSMRMIEMLNWIVEHSPSTEELSKFLGTSLSAAKERKSYIIKHMRELCQKYCGHDECAFSKHEVNEYD
jgi:RNA polymerase sigma factor (sigma-70 family)